MRVAAVTKNTFLYQKIKLALSGNAIVEIFSSLDYTSGFDVYLIDTASFDFSDNPNTVIKRLGLVDGARVILMGSGYDLPLPFGFEELYDAVSEASVAKSALLCGDRCAYLRDRKIPLTDVEFTLFEALYSAGGEFVSREKLMERVWGPDEDSGVLNVYIHYLRQKIEDGEKIIVSSRMHGYKIDERYIKKEVRTDA